MGGMVLETNMSEILSRIEDQNKMEKQEVCLLKYKVDNYNNVMNKFSINTVIKQIKVNINTIDELLTCALLTKSSKKLTLCKALFWGNIITNYINTSLYLISEASRSSHIVRKLKVWPILFENKKHGHLLADTL